MSIISEALKKAETASEPSGSHPSPPTPTPLWIYRAALLGCVAAVLLGIAHLTRRSAPAAAQAQAGGVFNPSRAGSVPSQTPVGRLLQLGRGNPTLSGIIKGGGGKSLALIDNQVVQEGDEIQGFRVVQVNLKSVEIQDGAGKTRMLELKD